MKVGRPFKAGEGETPHPTHRVATRRDDLLTFPRIQAVNDLATLNRPSGTKKAEQLLFSTGSIGLHDQNAYMSIPLGNPTKARP